MHRSMNTVLAYLLLVFEALILLIIYLPAPACAAGGVNAGELKSDPDRVPYKGAADDASEPEVARKICVVGIAKEGYFPFILIKPDGTTNGFDRRILSLIAYESGFDVKYRPVTWIDLMPNLKTHNIDVIASGMSITEERMAEVNFTNPYLWVSNVLVGREDKNLNVGTALTHNRIGVEKGTAAAVWMENNLIKKGKKISLVYYESEAVLIDDVINGKIAVAALDDTAARHAKRTKPLKILGPYGMPDTPLGYAVRKDDTASLEALNSGLNRIMASLYWRANRLKYFGWSQSTKPKTARETLSRFTMTLPKNWTRQQDACYAPCHSSF